LTTSDRPPKSNPFGGGQRAIESRAEEDRNGGATSGTRCC
jgi:hypothetical protein